MLKMVLKKSDPVVMSAIRPIEKSFVHIYLFVFVGLFVSFIYVILIIN